MAKKETRFFSTHRKANLVMDGIVFIIVIVVFGIISMIGFQSFSELKDDVIADVSLNESKVVVEDVESRYPSVMDGLMIFIFMGLWLFGIVGAYFSESHPMLFGVSMIALIFVIIAAVMLGNFYEELFQDSELSSMSASMPMTHWILTHMMPIAVVVVFSIALVFFGRNRG